MCFAPRYMSGPIALPSRPCKNTASFPDTPCASRPTEPRPTSSASAASPIVRCRLLLISLMARIARLVDIGTCRENPLGALGLGGLDCLDAGVDEGARHFHPLAVVHGPAGRQHQVARLGERCRRA